MGSDWLEIVEHAYRVDLEETQWLEGMLETTCFKLDQGFGAGALLYDASSLGSVRPLHFALQDAPAGLRVEDCLLDIPHDEPTPGFIRRTFGSIRCGLVSRTFGVELPAVLDRLERNGIVDIFAINGVDPSLRGCFFGVHLTRPTRFSPRTRAMCKLLSAHMAASYRLRRRLREADAGRTLEAVLSPGGKIVHAEGPAKGRDARDTLRTAVKSLERARGPMRRASPDEAMETWKGLVEGRWTLVDQFESDGKRYVIARDNTAEPLAFDALTPRERQVAGYAALGHPNKFIAYELGISVSTVGVLLSRACKKLGLRSRSALALAYQRQPCGARETGVNRDIAKVGRLRRA
jgi:DNA-binding CsgD family transcriptional regulator